MISYMPNSPCIDYKVELLEPLPVGFEALTVEEVEKGVVSGDYDVVNACGEYDIEGGTHIVDIATQTIVATVAHIDLYHSTDGGVWWSDSVTDTIDTSSDKLPAILLRPNVKGDSSLSVERVLKQAIDLIENGTFNMDEHDVLVIQGNLEELLKAIDRG